MTEKRLVIFDLGNVIFRLDWELMYTIWARHCGTDVPTLKSHDLFDTLLASFERGEVDTAEFVRRKIAAMNVSLTEEQFLEGWRAIIAEPFPESTEALSILKSSLKVVAFTNTSTPHLPILQELGARELERFDSIYASCELGFRKPDPVGFRYILEQEKTSLDQAVFFDDLEANVESALAFGIDAVLVKSTNDLLDGLSSFKLLK
jgi:putative hydrolase of the HAD superfamily